METKFNFTLTKPQVVEVYKKQARKATKALLIMAIAFLCFIVLLVVLSFFIEADYSGYIAVFLVLDLLEWLMVIFIRRAAAKNADNYFRYHSVNDVVEYFYELCETDFVINQPTIGNVVHYKYEMITRVIELDGYVAVMLITNQYCPIPTTEHTAPLIATLKSVARVKK